jgi:Rad3-related DNA helicase
MASIPLPALHVEAPQQPDTLGNFSKLLAIKQQQAMGPLQQQEAKQNIEASGLQLQQQQQQMKDQESFRTAMSDPSMQGKTIGQVADALAQKGQISQSAWSAAKKADTEHQQALATKTKTDLENMKAAHDQTQNLYNNVMSLPDDQLQAQWSAIAQQYNSIPGNEKMPMDPNKPLSKQQLSQFAPVISMGNTYFDQEMARRTKEAENTTAQANAKIKTEEATERTQRPSGRSEVPFRARQDACRNSVSRGAGLREELRSLEHQDHIDQRFSRHQERQHQRPIGNIDGQRWRRWTGSCRQPLRWLREILWWTRSAKARWPSIDSTTS